MTARTVNRTAFTLIEVILSLLLASGVVAVTGVVAVQSVQIQRAARTQVSTQWDRVFLFQQLEADIESIITWLPDSVEPLRVNVRPDELLIVHCLTSVPGGSSLARHRMPARVSYRVEKTKDGAERKRIIREVEDLTRPGGSGTRRILADDLVEVSFDIHSAEGWSNGSRKSNGRQADIDAVRLTCRFVSHPDREVTRTVLITTNQRGGQPPK